MAGYTSDQMKEMARAAATGYPKDPNAAATILSKMQNDPAFMAKMTDRFGYKFGGEPEQTTGSPRDTILDDMLFKAVNDGAGPIKGSTAPTSPNTSPAGKKVGGTEAKPASTNFQPDGKYTGPMPAADPRSADPAVAPVASPAPETGSNAGMYAAAAATLAGTAYAAKYGLDKAWQYYQSRAASGVPAAQIAGELDAAAGVPPPQQKARPAPQQALPDYTSRGGLPATVQQQGQALVPATPQRTDRLANPASVIPMPDETGVIVPEAYKPAGMLPAPPESSPMYDMPTGQRPTTSAVDAMVNDSIAKSSISPKMKTKVKVKK